MKTGSTKLANLRAEERMHTSFCWKPEGRRPRCRWKSTIEMDLEKRDVKMWIGCNWLWTGSSGDFFFNTAI
jgi:hypothetical protein